MFSRQQGLRGGMMVGWMIILGGSCGIEAETNNYAEKERVVGGHKAHLVLKDMKSFK